MDCRTCTFSNPTAAIHCEMCGGRLKVKVEEVIIIEDDTTTVLLSKTATLMFEEAFNRIYKKRKRAMEKLYWLGRIGMTMVPESNSNLYITDLITRPQLQLAVFSAYVIDQEWLETLIPPRTSVVLFCQRPKGRTVETTIQVSPTLRIVFPQISDYGCMHVKLMLLYYEDRVRVVIGSSNLVEYDWSQIENIVYYQDFRKLAVHQKSTGQFKDDLLTVLTDMNCPIDVTARLQAFDFSNAIGRLVFSKPGSSRDIEYGQKAMATIVRELDIPVRDQAYLYCQVRGDG